MDLKKLIGEMTQARGLPGYEGDVAAIFCREMEKIGLKTDTDAIGLIWARRAGRALWLPRIWTRSDLS